MLIRLIVVILQHIQNHYVVSLKLMLQVNFTSINKKIKNSSKCFDVGCLLENSVFQLLLPSRDNVSSVFHEPQATI